VSLLYRAARTMLSIPAVLLRRDTAEDAEVLVLRDENAVLRRQLKGPVRCEPADRLWLSVLSWLIPRRRRADVFPVTPGTPPAWRRRLIAKKRDCSARHSRTGRPAACGRAQEAGAAPGRRESRVGAPKGPGPTGPGSGIRSHRPRSGGSWTPRASTRLRAGPAPAGGSC
jgi:putative transposase